MRSTLRGGRGVAAALAAALAPALAACIVLAAVGAHAQSSSQSPRASQDRVPAGQGASHVAAVAATVADSPAPGGAQPSARVAPVVAGGVELITDQRSVRLVFTLSDPVEAKAFLLERPDRVIVDLPEVNFQLPDGTGRTGKGFVASFRYGLFAPGRSRVVIDLKEPALVARAVSRTASGQLAKLEIELTRTDRAAYRQAALKPMIDAGDGLPRPPALRPALSAETGKDSGKPLIVIDPGHGGVDTGAISPGGLVEKSIVAAFARRLKERLDSSGKYRTLLTREDDTFVALAERVRIARERKAALFVSVHADILSESPDVRGATVYTGSQFATDAEAARLADKENRADAVAGFDSVEEPEEIADILLDLTKRETRVLSNQFAKRLVGDLSQAVKLNKNPHRSAGFRVLKAPDVPSVLVEIGYLSSSKDADLMNSDEWQMRGAAALAGSIDSYFSARLAGSPRAAATP